MNLNKETKITFHTREGHKTSTVGEFFEQSNFANEAEYMAFLQDCLETGHATVKEDRSKDDTFAERVSKTIDAIHGKEQVDQDMHEERYGNNADDMIKDVKLTARSMSDAERIVDRLISVYNINEELVGYSKKGTVITVTIDEVHYKIFNKIKSEFVIKTVAQVTNRIIRDTVESAGTLAGIAVEQIAVPTFQLGAKVATDVASSAVKNVVRVGAFAATELMVGTKNTITSVVNDPETTRLRGALADTFSTMRKSMRKKGRSWGSGFGVSVG